MPRQNTMESKIRKILASDTESRNSDIRLTQVYWWTHHKEQFETINGRAYVLLANLYKLPSQDGIKRIRAKIQNEKHEFLPTRKEVALKRGMQEQEWRDYLGYETGDTL